MTLFGSKIVSWDVVYLLREISSMLNEDAGNLQKGSHIVRGVITITRMRRERFY